MRIFISEKEEDMCANYVYMYDGFGNVVIGEAVPESSSYRE